MRPRGSWKHHQSSPHGPARSRNNDPEQHALDNLGHRLIQVRSKPRLFGELQINGVYHFTSTLLSTSNSKMLSHLSVQEQLWTVLIPRCKAANPLSPVSAWVSTRPSFCRSPCCASETPSEAALDATKLRSLEQPDPNPLESSRRHQPPNHPSCCMLLPVESRAMPGLSVSECRKTHWPQQSR